jgi:DNA-binding beta-propeller fold protein YncE
MINTLTKNSIYVLLLSLLAACGGSGSNSSDLRDVPAEEPSIEAPTASIIFPPESALVDSNFIKIRGTASDAQGDTITRVSVNGVIAESDDGFATWQASVPLDLGENTLIVSTTDDKQTSNNAAAATVVQARALPFLSSSTANSGVEVDQANNRVLVIDSAQRALLAFDLSTGQRTVISSNRGIDAFDNQQGVGSGPGFVNPNNLKFDVANHRVLLTELLERQVYTVDINTGERSVFFDMNNTIGNGPALRLIRITLFDLANNRLLLLDGINRDLRLFAIDLADETRTLISSNANSGLVINNPDSMSLDSANNRVILSEPAGRIVAINLSNGEQTVLSGLNSTDSSIVGGGPNFKTPVDVDIDTSRNQALVSDAGLDALFIVDLATGNRTLLEGLGSDFISLRAADFFDENQIVAVDDGLETVIIVDRNTGDRTLLPANGIGEGPRLQTPRSFVQIDSGLLIADSEASHVFHVDVSNGNRSIFVNGNETILNSPRAIALDKANNRVLIVDNVDNIDNRDDDELNPRLLSLDLASKTLSIISGDGTGSGPGMTKPEHIALDSVNNRLLVIDIDKVALFSINLATGERSVISDQGSPGPAFDTPLGLALKSDGNTALVIDAFDGILFSINLQTGARSVISGENPDTGEIIGPGFALIDSHAIVLDEDNNRALISNLDDSSIFLVDLSTGIATELTDGLSAGPFLQEPIALIVDERNHHHAFVLDSAFRAVFTVDLLTGDRVLTSWSEVSPLNNLF